MYVKVLGCCHTSSVWSRSGCLLVDNCVSFDTGGLVSQLSIKEQVNIDNVFVTHAHLDHVGELAFLVDNVMTKRTSPLKVWGPAPVIKIIRQHLFNNHIWPDFSLLTYAGHQVLEFCCLPDNGGVSLMGLNICWTQTNHSVYSVGYLVSDCHGAFLYTGDTGPTEAIWELANNTTNLRQVFVETAFPDRLQAIADASGHLTPASLNVELCKLKCQSGINIMHVKPTHLAEIAQELVVLQRSFRILEGGEEFRIAETI